jgi:hypothetical protein
MRCHISCSFGPRLLAEVDSGATTCLTVPDLTLLLGMYVGRRELLPTPLKGHTACRGLKKSVNMSVQPK